MPLFTGNLEQYQNGHHFRVVKEGASLSCVRKTDDHTYEVRQIDLAIGTVLTRLSIDWQEHLLMPHVYWADADGNSLGHDPKFHPTLGGKWNGLPHIDYLVPLEFLDSPPPTRPTNTKSTLRSPRSLGKQPKTDPPRPSVYNPWSSFFQAIFEASDTIRQRRLAARKKDAGQMSTEEFVRLFPQRFGYYAEDLSHPLTSDLFASGSVFVYHTCEVAKDRTQGAGRVFLIANVADKPLVLDTAEKFLVVWRASGGDCVTFSDWRDQALVMADWAEAYHNDAIIIPAIVFESELAGEVIEKAGVAQTIILRLRDAVDLGETDQASPLEIHRQFINDKEDSE